MIIDFHTHIFPDRIAASTVRNLSGMSHTVPCTDGSAAQLTRSMKAAGVELSISLPVATKPEQVVKVNTLSAEANRRTKETGIFTFGCMHPYLENPEKELERIASLGMKGIKIHPVYQKTNLDDPGFLRIFRKAAELGMVVVTHAGFDVGYPGLDMCSPAMAARVVDKVPDLKLVLAHMGGWKQWDDVLRLLPDTNCFLDTSFSTESMIPLDDGYYRE